MEIIESYLPMDRRVAMAGGVPLPERTQGSALFADISGFTPLTEALARTLGPRRGAEELTVHLNRVYEALNQQVNQHAGSVTAFAGDAITCWFDQDDGLRATLCALAMQASMAQFATVSLPNGDTVSLVVKISVAAGPARRFLAGDPETQLLDILAGRTLARMGAAAQVAARGEIILDGPVAEALGKQLVISEWRGKGKGGAQYAVVKGCVGTMIATPWPTVPPFAPETLRPWLLRPVYDRMQAGQGEFLTELRPANVVFMKFEGIDYDEDEDARGRLDAYVRWVQEVVAHYGGFLLGVSIGDKGSHLHACFGAPLAHENDPWRAVAAAGDLIQPPASMPFVTAVKIGVSGGTLRTGAYGSPHRRTYGVLGDEVNMAARLMEHAAPGQVLVSSRLERSAGNSFRWKVLPPLKVKGKTEPVPVYSLLGQTHENASRLHESHYSLPMVGRKQELATIEAKLRLTLGGAGQTVLIRAEAGIGKTRLVAEAMRVARDLGFSIHVGQCQSHRVSSSYLVWQTIWHGLFDLPQATPAEQVTALEQRLAALDPGLLLRFPLLGTVLNLPIPDNDLTRPLEARLRKVSLEALLSAVLRKIAAAQPLLLVLEDMHWMDALSRDLLLELARATARVPVLLLVTQRPAELGRAEAERLASLPQCTTMELTVFTAEDAAIFAGLKLSQLFDYHGDVPGALLERLFSRAAGNPFYLEELLNFIKDQQLNFLDPQAITDSDLPESLHAVVLSRIDRLSENQQAAVKIASVIGRLFPAAVVFGMQTNLQHKLVAADLEELRRVDLTAVEQPEPEMVYMFKHVVTQEVAYGSLPHATRSRLHNEIALLLERLYPADLDQNLDLLAFHFDRTSNQEKKVHYLLRAGAAAQARYANADAINYFERVMPLLEPAQRVPALLKLGKVRELIGEWKKAGACYQRAFEAAEAIGDVAAQAQSQVATGDLLRKQALYSEATDWLSVARTRFEEIGDRAGVGQALHAAGTVAAMQGDYLQAGEHYQQSLKIRQELGDKVQEAALLSNLGIIASRRPRAGATT